MTLNISKQPNSVETYFNMLSHLNTETKLDLILKLTESVKAETAHIEAAAEPASGFGSWVSDESAEEIIDMIRSSRTFNHTIEPF